MRERIKLDPVLNILLQEVMRKREPSLLGLVDSLVEKPLSTEEREMLTEVLLSELGETGLQPNNEPNERGLRICELMSELDTVGLPQGSWALGELWQRIDLGVAVEQEKIAAASLAGESQDLRYVSRLLTLLDEQEGQVRYYALQSLVLDLNQIDKAMEERCWKLLRDDPDEDVRGMAAACLGRIYFASLSPETFSLLLAEIKSPYQSAHVKGSIYGALFKVAGRPPSEWPGLQGPPKVFEESDIDWEKVAWLQDQVENR